MQILTVVYGAKHVEIFRRTALKSLAFKENRKAIYAEKSKWNICTDDESRLFLEREIDAFFPELELNFIPTSKLRDYVDATQSAIIRQIKSCLDSKERLLIAPPDTAFGDGTVSNLIRLGRESESVICVPHVRVLPEFLSEPLDCLSNAELVSKSWPYLHQSWTDAEVGHPRRSSFAGGVSWQRCGEKLYSVTHRLPTPYYMDFTEEDLKYFKNQISFGGFDHTWPSDILIPRGRHRFVASSDLCFMAEVTEKDKNVPPVWPGDVDSFWRLGIQEKHNAQIIATFRGG